MPKCLKICTPVHFGSFIPDPSKKNYDHRKEVNWHEDGGIYHNHLFIFELEIQEIVFTFNKFAFKNLLSVFIPEILIHGLLWLMISILVCLPDWIIHEIFFWLVYLTLFKILCHFIVFPKHIFIFYHKTVSFMLVTIQVFHDLFKDSIFQALLL